MFVLKTQTSGAMHNTMQLWDPVTREHRHTLTEYTDDIYSVAFSPDGSTLASAGWDGTVLLWDLTSITEPPPPPVTEPPLVGDINSDGIVNIQDLAIVGANYGKTGPNAADLNGDGIVNIFDLVKVAGALGTGEAAPSAHLQALSMFTIADVQGWLTQAQGLNLTDLHSQRGIRFLEQLLDALRPKEMALLQNYPNPFNPETWIPYHLSDEADVQIIIYDTQGLPVRQLELGYQLPGYYVDRAKAAYWDGRNQSGEAVASGVYFYILTAGDYSATRKMLILK